MRVEGKKVSKQQLRADLAKAAEHEEDCDCYVCRAIDRKNIGMRSRAMREKMKAERRAEREAERQEARSKIVKRRTRIGTRCPFCEATDQKCEHYVRSTAKWDHYQAEK